MDGWMYPASLLLIALLAFTFFQNHNSKLMLVALLIGVYIIYSHETGDSATDWKNEMVESLDESAEDYSDSHGTGGYDATKAKERVR